jgi:hypothetical protein
MTVASINPVEMASEGLDSTVIRRLDEIAERVKQAPPPSNPVKDIVIPLTVVIALLGNALMIGIAWGRFSQRMDGYDAAQQKLEARVTAGAEAGQDLRDRMRDAERDIKDAERRFLLLDDYTRGRIDRLPYKSPPPQRW